MTVNAKSIYYITTPKNDLSISMKNISKLKRNYNDFYFDHIEGYYRFLYKDLDIIISEKGRLQLSLISMKRVSQDLCRLAKMAKKINFLLGIEDYTKRFMI